MKIVKITKDYKGYKKGSVTVVSDSIYEMLDGEGVVKLSTPKSVQKDMKAEDKECESGNCQPKKKTYKTKVVNPEK